MPKPLKYGPQRKNESAGRGPFVDGFTELFKHQRNARAALMVAHGMFELLVTALVERKCKNGKKIAASERDFGYAAKLVILHEIGAIDDKWYGSLNLLRQTRNRAAHEPFFELTKADLAIRNLLATITDRWPKFYPDTPEGLEQMFFETLTCTLGAFWNENNTIFAPMFGEPTQTKDAQVGEKH